MLNRTRLSSLDAFGLRDQRNRIYPALEASDGSTLSLDFTAMGDTLDSRFTFTRSSTTSTYINSSGLVATAGTNVPRFDYDPTTLSPRGLLIEGSASNIATYSNDFSNAIWTLDTSGGTIPAVSTVSQTGPDGASTVTRITFNKTGGVFSRVRQTLSGTASQPYTMSVWMKANTASGGASTQNVGLRIGADSAGFNCTVTTTWKRFQYTYTLSGTDAAAQIMLWDNIIGNDETADVLVYGCQMEAGSGASSYIPTGSSTVTRAADKLSMTNISLMGWNQTAGTFLWDMDVQSETNRSSYPAFAGMYRAGPVRVVRFQLNNSSGTTPRIGGDTWTAAPGAIVTGAFYTRPVGTPFKAAVAFANTGQSMTYCINGTVQSAVTGTGTLATPTLFLMHQDPSAADTEYFPIHLRQLKYWPTNLSSSDLRSITT